MFDKNFEKFLNDKIVDYGQIGKYAGKKDITVGKTLDNMAGISVGLSSKEQIRSLSYGEVLISETINYRTQRPERGGLFCEQIFGPRKNYECACGKYKRIKYKGIICERCGVEVTTSQVRRQRAGHIELAAPIAHIWYLKSIPSRIGLLLEISIKKLEQVIYFASYLITDVYEEKRQDALRELENIYKSSKIELQKKIQQQINDAQLKLEAKEISKDEFKTLETTLTRQLDGLDNDFNKIKTLLKTLKEGTVIGELDYRILYDKFPHTFRGGSGAEFVKILLERIDLKRFIAENQKELKTAPKAKQKKILQKLKLASSLFKSNQRPENFILDALLVIPPDLRPMIQLDGGRFASSDLNDLYRRVINRNNRLRKLSELGAPDVILKNEKRMLQEAVDMLINGDVRSNRPGYITATKKKLKSLADILKGKQGRFRQNLLGKRVDYSGRSVIIVGPKLKMNECGLPKLMALTLFKPFVIHKLIEKEIAYNVKHAEKVIEERGKDVWDALDEVIIGKHVLLNRAPTLHRLGIQAFRPVLIEGKAIQLHPLSCKAFNADFDGDQMAVHIPLTVEAQREAAELMTPSKNILNPSNGEPIISPDEDMVLGAFYLTRLDEGEAKYAFADEFDAMYAYEGKVITFHTPIKIRVNGEIMNTSYGRILFNKIVPKELGFRNEPMNKGNLQKLLANCFDIIDSESAAALADEIKNIGYKYGTLSGITFSKGDMIVPENKHEYIKGGEDKIKEIQKHFWMGYMTEYERYLQSIKVWANVKTAIEKEMKVNFKPSNPLYNMIESKARGNWGNLTQLCGMKGLVASPSGKTIELPIKSNLREGFTTLEYFIATHGGRKGKADTALKTAQSGYLTRRLVDASQNVIVSDEDCGSVNYKMVSKVDTNGVFQESFDEKIFGKFTAKDIVKGKEVLFPAGTLIDKIILEAIKKSGIEELAVRSILTCETEGGICQKCYGLDLGYNSIVKIGTPVGIIAAQSIGEPGTQLTMRTFHSGGVAKEGGDITAGLTRVEELFEARKPKYEATVADFNGKVTSVKYDAHEVVVTLLATDLESHEYYIPSADYKVLVKKKDKVNEKQILAKSVDGKNKLTAIHAGIVEKIDENVIIVKDEQAKLIEYRSDAGRNISVKKGDVVKTGEKLIEGHIDTHKLMELVGLLKTEDYIINEIKAIYSSQGQTVNSKHIEIIVRQMFAKVKIIAIGDSSFFPGDVVEMVTYKKENERLLKAGQKPAVGHSLLLGLTKASLFTESWLAAASFQETVRTLVDASVSGKIDTLTGLKENVIIGRLIPTLQYFRNNQNVGDYFDYHGSDEDELVAAISDYSGRVNEGDLENMAFDEE